VAELKKGRYVYCHCTGHRGNARNPTRAKGRLLASFAGTLGELVVPREVLDWLAQEVSSSDQTQHAARAAAIKRSEAELGCLRHRLNVLYEDRLCGRMTKTFYDEKSKTILLTMMLMEAQWKDGMLHTTLLELLELLRRSNQANIKERNQWERGD
jgi:hypothetical protein